MISVSKIVSTVVPKSSPVVMSLFPAKGSLPNILKFEYLFPVLFKTVMSIVANLASVPSSNKSVSAPCFTEDILFDVFSVFCVFSFSCVSSFVSSFVSDVCPVTNPSGALYEI